MSASSTSENWDVRIAIVIPCHNEELTVAKVVTDAYRVLPDADVFVFDNASTDKTAELARKARAKVIPSPRKGKGHVIRHAFSAIDADVLLVVDGDDTYPMDVAPRLVDLVMDGHCDMAVGDRLSGADEAAFRPLHHFGNHAFSGLISWFFGQKIGDMLSGFRAFSREFYKLVPLNSNGFEVETDLTLQAISKGFSIAEVPVSYKNRPEGSFSKLSTFGDGYMILKFIARVARNHRPLPFFSIASALCFCGGLLAGYAPVKDFIEHAYVYTVPRAILAASLMVLSVMLIGVGLILDAQIRSFNEQFSMLRRILSANASAAASRKLPRKFAAGE